MNLDATVVAKRAGLHYSIPNQHGIRRLRRGKSFVYVTDQGRAVRDEKTLERIRKLAIPPAYEEVVIAKDPLAHLQAIGRDARGRKQYRYHPKWFEAQGNQKYHHILEFARMQPLLRRVTAAHLRKPGLCREKVLATVVQLLEKTWIRIGNDEYVKQNHSYGLSTLQNQHVKVSQDRVVFKFLGKSKVRHEISLKDPRLAKVIRECHRTPGKELFQYQADDGTFHRIHSHDVNAYLKEITGRDFTAKDFRTWGATVYAAEVLSQLKCPEKKTVHRQVLNEAIDQVAAKLGNTRSICRKSYIHPEILTAFDLSANRLQPCARTRAGSIDQEKWVMSFLKLAK